MVPSLRSPRVLTVRRRLGVLAAGLAVVASCAAPPAPPATPEAPDGPESSDSRWGRRGSDRRSPRTTSTTVPGAPASTTTTTVAPPPTGGSPASGPLGASGAWTLKFADEFDGNSLDLSKWRPNWFGSSDSSATRPVNDYEEACYDPAQATVSGGTLRLTATRLSSSKAGCTKKDGSTASYATGFLSSNHDYRFTYGFIEARIHLPGNGTPENWAAFWANGQDWPYDGEIDVMETLGGEPRWHYHYAGPNGSDRSYGSDVDLISPKSGWHTFGADWQPGRITFYYDGKAVGSVTSNVTSSPMYLILSNSLSSYISGPMVAPSTMQVDYVRHWQR